jgi:hypothetical protein
MAEVVAVEVAGVVLQVLARPLGLEDQVEETVPL